MLSRKRHRKVAPWWVLNRHRRAREAQDSPFTIFGPDLQLWLPADMGITLTGGAYTAPNAFDDAAWIKVNLSVTPNDAIAPGGGMTADKITEVADASPVQRYVLQSPPAQDGPDTFITIDVKADDGDWFGINGNSVGTAWFNVAAGTIGTVPASVTATLTAIDGYPGWYRCTYRGPASVSVTLHMSDADNNPGYTITAGNERSLWVANADFDSHTLALHSDQSGKDHDFNQGTIARRPLWDASIAVLDGRPGILADDTDDQLQTVDPKAIWKFLHDGTGCTIAFVFHPTAAGAVLDNCRGNPASHGLILSHTGAGFVLQVANGSGAYIVNSGLGGAATGSTYVLVIRMKAGETPEVHVRQNGIAKLSTSFGGTGPSSSDPTWSLALLDLASTSALPIGGYLAETVIANVYATDAQVQAVEQWAAKKYPSITLP